MVGTITQYLKGIAISALVFICFALQASASLAADALTVQATPDSFVIRYCQHDNYTTDPAHSSSWYLSIYSNGTATVHAEQGASSDDWVSQLSGGLVAQAYDILSGEGLMSMTGYHNDTGYVGTNLNHTENVCLEISGSRHIVSFGGNSMMGMLPQSFALVNNIMLIVIAGWSELPNVEFDVTVSERATPGPIADVRATFTNHGGQSLEDYGMCNTSWPALFVSRNGTTVDDIQTTSAPLCAMTFEPNTTDEFGPWAWNRSGLAPGEYIVMSRIAIWSWTSTNISADAAWAGHNDDTPSDPGNNSLLYIVAGGIGVAAVACVAAFYIIRMRGRGPPEKPL